MKCKALEKTKTDVSTKAGDPCVGGGLVVVGCGSRWLLCCYPRQAAVVQGCDIELAWLAGLRYQPAD